jgi:predicted enzyme related to lactoylglutathione lyase
MHDMPGQIGWIDLTVPDATGLRDFYQGVTGWTPSPVKTGDYHDFCMHPPGDSQPVAGICHAKGENVGLPTVWLAPVAASASSRIPPAPFARFTRRPSPDLSAANRYFSG